MPFKVQERPPHQRVIWTQMSIVLKVRKPGLDLYLYKQLTSSYKTRLSKNIRILKIIRLRVLIFLIKNQMAKWINNNTNITLWLEKQIHKYLYGSVEERVLNPLIRLNNTLPWFSVFQFLKGWQIYQGNIPIFQVFASYFLHDFFYQWELKVLSPGTTKNG